MSALRRFFWSAVAFSFVVITACAVGQVVTSTVATGVNSAAAAVNTVTNTIYVSNQLCNAVPCPTPGTVSVIDGTTNHASTVSVGVNPGLPAVNSVTNKIYVPNLCGNDPSCQSPGTVTVIDGATLTTRTVNVGYVPGRVVVNSVTNKIYVVNQCPTAGIPSCTINHTPGTITVIDGVSLSTQPVTVGFGPVDAAVNSTTNTIYVANQVSQNNTIGSVSVIDGNTLTVVNTVPVGSRARSIAFNPSTNQIYVANLCGDDEFCQGNGTVTVIDAATFLTQSAPTGFFPFRLAINTATNKIYVANECSDPSCSNLPIATIIDGATLATSSVPVCTIPTNYPADLQVNQTANQTYVSCQDPFNPSLIVTVIDGATTATTPVAVGDQPAGMVVNEATNTAYVPNFADGTVSEIGANTTLQFVSMTPCRLVDTRPEYGGSGPIPGGTSETFNVTQLGGCNIPTNAAAYALNVTVVPNGRLGFLTLWPASQLLPNISLMNSLDGRIKANAATVQAGVNGAISVYVNNTTNVLIDIDGYYAPAGPSTLDFYNLPPCRVVDTRNTNGHLAGPFLAGNQQRDFPVLESSCIPAGINAQAYSFNITAVPHPTGQRLGFLTVWQTGEPRPDASTLNNPTGTIVANAAIVPAGTDGAISVFPNNDTDLLIDINGYFAAPGQNGLSLYPTPPCRVLDTRQGGGQPFVNELTVFVKTSPCGPGGTAQAYVLNATVVPQPTLGFLALWADGAGQPGVSTLNAKDGAITSNMAIVPTTNGLIDAFANNLTQLVLDISAYFAP